MIYLDSCLLIYAAENHPRFAERVINALEYETGQGFAISPLSAWRIHYATAMCNCNSVIKLFLPSLRNYH